MTSTDPTAPPRPDEPDPAVVPGAAIDGPRSRTAGVTPERFDLDTAHPSSTRRGRSRKVSRWDRPAPPKDWRWWVGHTGRVLIAIGLLMFGFVAYQLWGTAIETARAQARLESDFEDQLAAVEPIETAPPTSSPPSSSGADDDGAAGAADADGEPAAKKSKKKKEKEPQSEASSTVPTVAEAPAPVPVADQNIPAVENGDALARIEIERLGLDVIVVAGVTTSDLKRGPGHYPDTPLPGQLGNAAIAGHRTTYGQPFHDIDDLQPGDEIVVTTLSGRFVYGVTGQQIVKPSDYEVVATVDPTVANLTLTSCHPKWTAQERIVVTSALVAESSGPVGEPVLNYGRDTPEPAAEPDDGLIAIDDPTLADTTDPASATDTTDPGSATDTTDPVSATASADDERPAREQPTESAPEVSGSDGGGTAVSEPAGLTQEGIADAFAEGWFSDPGAPLHVVLWGSVLAAIAYCGYLISRRFRRDWVGLLVGVVPFLVALYFFYQNVNRLLPPNL